MFNLDIQLLYELCGNLGLPVLLYRFDSSLAEKNVGNYSLFRFNIKQLNIILPAILNPELPQNHMNQLQRLRDLDLFPPTSASLLKSSHKAMNVHVLSSDPAVQQNALMPIVPPDKLKLYCCLSTALAAELHNASNLILFAFSSTRCSELYLLPDP